MSEKELLYIEDTLGHMESIKEYLANYTVSLDDKNFETVLQELDKLNNDLYKKFYKLISE